jgi:hypothetical protein
LTGCEHHDRHEVLEREDGRYVATAVEHGLDRRKEIDCEGVLGHNAIGARLEQLSRDIRRVVLRHYDDRRVRIRAQPTNQRGRSAVDRREEGVHRERD